MSMPHLLLRPFAQKGRNKIGTHEKAKFLKLFIYKRKTAKIVYQSTNQIK